MDTERAQDAGKDLLKKARRRRRWSYGRLVLQLTARGVSVGRSWLSQVEKGKREPSNLAFVVALEEVLGVPVESWPNFSALPRLMEMRRRAAA